MDIVINGRFLTQPVSGVQRYAHEIVRSIDAILDEKPHLTVSIASPCLSSSPQPLRNIPLRQAGRLQGHAWEQLELPAFARGKMLFCPGNTAPLASLFGSQRVVVTVHDLSYLYFPDAYSRSFRRWYGVLIPQVLRRAAAVITVSESERRAIAAHYPEVVPRLHAVQNGGLPVGFDGAASDVTDCDGGYVLYVGSLSKRKNFPMLLDSACQLVRRRGFKFVFVGEVPKGIAASTVQVSADFARQIKFLGQINHTETLISHYRRAACFIFPSLYEASPLPPIEAMACGCPVAASDIESLRERCGDAAIYCDPRDVDSIAAAIERIMDDRVLRAKLTALGRERAKTFNWDRCARQTLDIICDAC